MKNYKIFSFIFFIFFLFSCGSAHDDVSAIAESSILVKQNDVVIENNKDFTFSDTSSGSSLELELKIKNKGEEIFYFKDSDEILLIEDEPKNQFVLTQPSARFIDVGEELSFKISFNPTQAGDFKALVVIPNHVDEKEYKFFVKGRSY